MTHCFYFSRDILAKWADHLPAVYAAARPFPHVEIEPFFPEDIVPDIARGFPPLRPEHWSGSGDADPNRKHKYMSGNESLFGDVLRQALYQLNSSFFVEFLERLTGIEGLIPDPYLGGALRCYTRGGLLGVHTDYNWHNKLKLYRRVNLIVYLNREWPVSFGGELELWTTDWSRCAKRIFPGWNKAVIFGVDDRSPHGFPAPLRCPEGYPRKSLQLYYYSARIPDADKWTGHATVFRDAR